MRITRWVDKSAHGGVYSASRKDNTAYNKQNTEMNNTAGAVHYNDWVDRESWVRQHVSTYQDAALQLRKLECRSRDIRAYKRMGSGIVLEIQTSSIAGWESACIFPW